MNSNTNEKRFIKSVLKKSKFLSFSTSLLVSFLITGQLSFADTSKDIPTRIEINSGIENESAKVENLLKNNKSNVSLLDLEIFKLLNQGKQVIKPWERSWQFGIGYWHGINKGKRYSMPSFVDDTYSDPLEKYTASKHSHKTYGHITVPQITEPSASIKLTVGIPLKKEPHFYDIEKPDITIQNIKNNPVYKVGKDFTLSFGEPYFSEGASFPQNIVVPDSTEIQKDNYSTWFGNGGIFSQISLKTNENKNSSITIDNDNDKLTFDNLNIDTTYTNGMSLINKDNKQFQGNTQSNIAMNNLPLLTLANVPYAYIGNNITITDKAPKKVTAATPKRVIVAFNPVGTVPSMENKPTDLRKTQELLGINSSNNETWFINHATVNLSGNNSKFFVTDRPEAPSEYGKYTSYIINEGDLNLTGEYTTGFYHKSNDQKTTIYENNENIEMTGNFSVGAMFSNATLDQTTNNAPNNQQLFINNGTFSISSGYSNFGISIGDTYNDVTNKKNVPVHATIDLKEPIKINGGSEHTGIIIGYANLTEDSKIKVDIDNTNNSKGITIRSDLPSNQYDTYTLNFNHDINIGENTNSNVGFYVHTGKVSTLPNSKINILGGNENFGIYGFRNGTKPVYPHNNIINTDISIKNGKDHIGIYDATMIFNGSLTIGEHGSNHIPKNTAGIIYSFQQFILGKDGSLDMYLELPPEAKPSIYSSRFPVGIYAINPEYHSFTSGIPQIVLSQSEVPAKPQIKIHGVSANEFGIFAGKYSLILSKNQNILAENLQSAVLAINRGKVDLSGSTLEYNGPGYALFNLGNLEELFEGNFEDTSSDQEKPKADITTDDERLKINEPPTIIFENGNLILKGHATAAIILPYTGLWFSQETIDRGMYDSMIMAPPLLYPYPLTDKELLAPDIGPDSEIFKYTDGAMNPLDPAKVDIDAMIKKKLKRYQYDDISVLYRLNNTNITAMSNDVVVFKNWFIPRKFNSSNIYDLFISPFGKNINISNGSNENGEPFDKYKISVIDKREITIDKPMIGTDSFDSSGSTALRSAQDKNDFVFRRLVARRLKLTVNSKVQQYLSTKGASPFFNQVVGLLNISNSKATSNEETLTLISETGEVNAARTGIDIEQPGAVGIFTNYGTVLNNGKIIVENTGNPNDKPHNQGIGIYAVNGSKITNNGSIEVYGNHGIGILPRPHTVNENDPIKDKGQGKIDLTNNGSITMHGDSAVGIYIGEKPNDFTLVNEGTVNILGNSSIALMSKAEGVNIENKGTINIGPSKGSIGMYGENIKNITHDGVINLNGSSPDKRNIGIYADNPQIEIVTTKDSVITGNKYDAGIDGLNVKANGTINVGENGIGIISTDGNVDISTGTINVGRGTDPDSPAVGIYAQGTGTEIKTSDKTKMTIADGGYGFFFDKLDNSTKAGVDFTTNIPKIDLEKNSVFVFSKDKNRKININTEIKASGNNNYAVYGTGNITNNVDIDFSHGTGNIALYANREGNITNNNNIKIGGSDPNATIDDPHFGIGMAAGYYNSKHPELAQKGTVINNGTIEVIGDGGVGMAAMGPESKAINNGYIKLKGNNSVGLYAANGGIGINETNGVIETTADAGTGIVGVYAFKGGIIKNYGKIKISGEGNYGKFLAGGSFEGNEVEVDNGATLVKDTNSPQKEINGVDIQKGKSIGTLNITIADQKIVPVIVSKLPEEKNPLPKMKVEFPDMKDNILDTIPGQNMTRASKIGMYVDTSGRRKTNPIEGLSNVQGLDEVQLLIGNEAANYTNASAITIDSDITKPFTDEIVNAHTSVKDLKINISAANIGWLATGLGNGEDIKSITLVKVPYTNLGTDAPYNFLAGLDERYGTVDLAGEGKKIFNKVNSIGKAQLGVFAQALYELEGHQYANTQRRINEAHSTFYDQFDNLSNWENKTKDTMKVKFFKGENRYNNKHDDNSYKRNVDGVMVMNDLETVRVGERRGVYVGAANEKFDFKDLVGSKEKAITAQFGYFNSKPYGYNNEVNWTWKAGMDIGRRKMERKYKVVDEVFTSKGKYTTADIFLHNKLSRNFILGEHFTVSPYTELDLTLGRSGSIHEKGGLPLKVKDRTYFNATPGVGLVSKLTVPVKNSKIVSSVDMNLSKQIIDSGKVKMKVADTGTGYYHLKKDKNSDAIGTITGRVGIENDMFGVDVKAQYSTYTKGISSGVEFRYKF